MISTQSKTEQIARMLCELMDDEWEIGKNLYMSWARKIIRVARK